MPRDQKAPYESLAAGDKGRYDREMKVWRAKEKERKAMRESGSKANAQSFEWSTLASITGARKGFGEDPQSMRNISADPSLPLSDMISGIGARGQSSSMLQLQDHESRGAFHSSIYSNYNNNLYSMDSSPDQASNMMMQHQQRQQQLEDLSAYSSSPSFNMADRRQLASFNSMMKDNLEQTSSVTEHFPYDIGNTPQATQPNQYQNNPFLAPRGMKNASKTMAWSNQRSAPNMDNAMSTSIDLEPLPLPDNHPPQQQGKLTQKRREGQMGWAGLRGLQQMHARDQQQQRTTIASDEQFLRRLSTGGTPMFTAGWGQNNLWNTDTNESIAVAFGGRNINSGNTGRNAMMSSQDIGSNPLEEAKSGNDDARSFPSPSNNPNQDLYRYYNDGPI